jgi:plastocyanin
MIEWQDSLTKSLQKENPNGNVTTKNDEMNEMEEHMTEMEEHRQEQPLSSQPSSDTNQVSIVRGATTLGDKSYLPNPLRIKVGSTVVWTNNDSTLHTVTSGTANAENVGEAFDSGLTAFITPAKTYSNKFTNTGEFTYFCRVHPTMIGKIVVVP